MILQLALTGALLLGQPTPPAETDGHEETEADEIVVRAVRGKCRVQLADRLLTNRELDARAEQWANGKAVRVIEPVGADYKCLAKITFRLGDKGVRLIEFVDRPAQP